MSSLYAQRLAGVDITRDCVCSVIGGSDKLGTVHGVDGTPLVYPAGAGGALPGLTAAETAILAGVLAGLAAFLFLALPILCCLLPCACCPCCAKGKKGAAAAGGGAKKLKGGSTGTDVESYWSTNSWGEGGKIDYENLYGVDMKLPRPWVDSLRGVPDDQLDSKLRELETSGNWEGVDIGRDSLDGPIHREEASEALAQMGMVQYGDNSMAGTMGRSGGGHAYSTVERGSHGGGGEGGGETVTEYEVTRRMDIHFEGMNEDDVEDYYRREFSDDFSKDNFMKIYNSYRRALNSRNPNA